ncbi:bola-like protein-domain-containing protein [Phakopsora pachyrhizi]|nr:bola-like protein-domain-containing protein [Phakopsora pachyrhizi]
MLWRIFSKARLDQRFRSFTSLTPVPSWISKEPLTSAQLPILLRKLHSNFIFRSNMNVSSSDNVKIQNTLVSSGPIESSIRKKMVEEFKPTQLEIKNDSHLHSHHSAMKAIGGGSGETHFSVAIISDKFEKVSKIQRHRMVYELLKDELNKEGGIHALSIQAFTPEEAK